MMKEVNEEERSCLQGKSYRYGAAHRKEIEQWVR